MNLKSGLPFWAIKNGLIQQYPTLAQNLTVDIAIMGGGITGALLADHFTAQGYRVVVLERREFGWGSSAASTALLQYEIDEHLCDLAKRFGEDNAVLAYTACAEAITDFKRRTRNFANIDFAMQSSLYFASCEQDIVALEREYELRRKHGFAVNWLNTVTLRQRYAFSAPAGIHSELAARVDPYKTAHLLLQRVQRSGNHVFERTEVAGWEAHSDHVKLMSKGGHRIQAKHLIIASGYESQRYLKQTVAMNRSSYACISDPISKAALGPLTSTLIWESARPYIYVRSTHDGRILIGGEDDDIDNPKKRNARVDAKARMLNDKVQALWPHLAFQQAFAWAGTFAETKDGLPFFGPHPETGSRIHFAMAYGGNGITYSVIGCQLLQAWIEGSDHPLKALFSFARIQ